MELIKNTTNTFFTVGSKSGTVKIREKQARKLLKQIPKVYILLEMATIYTSACVYLDGAQNST